MFQFSGLAFDPYFIQDQIPSLTIINLTSPTLRSDDIKMTIVEGGFPHSEIFGSKPVRSSPKLIAAYHVLHRLSAPRHPPNALIALNRSHYQCSPLGRVLSVNRTNIVYKTSISCFQICLVTHAVRPGRLSTYNTPNKT